VSALLALAPAAAVCVAVLLLRWSGLAASALAVLISLALWGAQGLSGTGALAPAAVQTPPSLQLLHAVVDASLLACIVAAMVLPGILFVEATARRGSTQAITRLVASLRLPQAQAAILIAVGIGVMIESLTGMGVSLLVTMPLLLVLADRTRAIAFGLVGMSLMPWGALSISGLIGAKLAGLPVETLALAVWGVSAPVACALPFLCFAVADQRRANDLPAVLLAAVVLVASIGATSWLVGIEIAGVAGGLSVAVVMGLLAKRDPDWREALSSPALLPYLVLIMAVVVQKILVAGLLRSGFTLELTTGRVSWSVLTSPGVALLTATLLTVPAYAGATVLKAVLRRGWRPVASVAMFMLSARLLVEIGGIASLGDLVSGFGFDGAIVAIALLGAISGFITGSGITANALFMPSAAIAGRVFDAVPLFAALQNSAAGHTAMASLPVAAILLAALPERNSSDDRTVLRLGLAIAMGHLAVIVLVVLLRRMSGLT